MSENNCDNSLSTFLLGGIIGATIGLLFAPRKGVETRAILTKLIDEVREKGLDTALKTKDKAKDLYEDGKDFAIKEKGNISKVIKAGKKIYNKTK